MKTYNNYRKVKVKTFTFSFFNLEIVLLNLKTLLAGYVRPLGRTHKKGNSIPEQINYEKCTFHSSQKYLWWTSLHFSLLDFFRLQNCRFLTIAYHVYPLLLNPLRLQQKSVAAKELNANNFEIYYAPVLQLQSTIFVFSWFKMHCRQKRIRSVLCLCQVIHWD